MLVPAVTTESDSAVVSGRVVSVIVAEDRFALSTSVMSAFGATFAGPESSVKLAEVSKPAVPEPLRSVTGASFTQLTVMLTVTVFPSVVPSLGLYVNESDPQKSGLG